ncbi:hypothetical protein IAQ61_008765 [Plenodomus lingam]|uniref:uncharacterized protein n=1 Tax=Leptosphaeria maculans TaxID=5022 RepID=UPI00332A24E9|nr:hypothetical protein IAQ61_008765 [Plenodomus lingam]
MLRAVKSNFVAIFDGDTGMVCKVTTSGKRRYQVAPQQPTVAFTLLWLPCIASAGLFRRADISASFDINIDLHPDTNGCSTRFNVIGSKGRWMQELRRNTGKLSFTTPNLDDTWNRASNPIGQELAVRVIPWV